MADIVIGKLKVGDTIVVSNVLMGLREYPVKSIEGNKAITAFRDFNTKIYPGGNVYEYGKRYNDNWYANGYWVKKIKEE